jgi:hypothetical protein
VAELGSRLMLPPMYEPMRDRIRQALPPLRLPHVTAEEAI